MPSTQPRHDLYGPVHKGLRRATGELLVKLGACNFADPAETAAVLAELRPLMGLCAAHIHHEELHIHPALEARRPGATDPLVHDHLHHRARFDEIEAYARAVEIGLPAARAEAGRALYLAFAAFLAEDFAHMDHEERVIQPMLHALFTDEELIAIEGAILQALAPDTTMMFLRMMLPASTPDEQFAMMNGVRLAASAEAFDAILQAVARPSLAPERMQRLETRLRAAA